MANWHMKRCSTPLIIREMQVKITIRYHLSPVRVAVIKKGRHKKCLQGCGKLVRCWWDCNLVQPPWKTACRCHKKITVELLYNSAISVLGISLKTTKTLTCGDACTPLFPAELLTGATTRKQPRCPPTEDWAEKMWCGGACIRQRVQSCHSWQHRCT